MVSIEHGGADFNSFDAPIERLFNKGVRYSTVIDVGCADGHFFLAFFYKGFFQGAVPLHVDANPIFEDSLRAIKEVIGGDYRISAVAERIGETEFTESVHPYWSSIRPSGDLYWSRVNDLVKTKTRTAMTTLDALVAELGLKPPFLLKLDVQGAEGSALAGARNVLAETDVVICEADVADFHDLDRALVTAGFALYDLTGLARVKDGELGWFYPVYVSERLRHVLPQAFWDSQDNESIIGMQVERRSGILKTNAAILNRIKYRDIKVGRNDPCPCGSGRKFKHCCGTYAFGA